MTDSRSIDVTWKVLKYKFVDEYCMNMNIKYLKDYWFYQIFISELSNTLTGIKKKFKILKFENKITALFSKLGKYFYSCVM